MAIEYVRLEQTFDVHENANRTIVTLAKEGYEVVRVAKLKRDAELGNHWREYPEEYAVIGQADFTLEDIDTKQREIYSLRTGYMLFIPPRIAMKVKAQEGTVLIALSPELKREEKTHHYEVK